MDASYSQLSPLSNNTTHNNIRKPRSSLDVVCTQSDKDAARCFPSPNSPQLRRNLGAVFLTFLLQAPDVPVSYYHSEGSPSLALAGSTSLQVTYGAPVYDGGDRITTFQVMHTHMKLFMQPQERVYCRRLTASLWCISKNQRGNRGQRSPR